MIRKAELIGNSTSKMKISSIKAVFSSIKFVVY